jgi:uncharacterized protein YqgC (DUF456 family)
MSPTGWWIIAVLLILFGVAGSFVPAVPGVILVFGGMLLGAWVDRFGRIGWVTLAILGLLAALALLGDILGGLIGAKRVGASRAALLGAALGGLVGIFFGLVGALLGPFLGAVAGELFSRKSHLRQAARVGAATWVGLAFSFVFRLVIVFAMLAVFVTSYFL